MMRRGALQLLLLLLIPTGGAEAATASKTGTVSFPPFHSRVETAEGWQEDFLWPLYTRKQFQNDMHSRLLMIGFWKDFGTPEGRHRSWLFPFFFSGVSSEGTPYMALFPIGGSLYDFMTYDYLAFLLFPLYGVARVNDASTTSVLWPVYSRTCGEGLHRFRVWPFYGVSRREGLRENRFVLWPVYTSVKMLNAAEPKGGFILFPFYGRVDSGRVRTRWYLPPFFSFSQREEQQTGHAPWPFVQWADGKVKKRYLWPLFGWKETSTEHSSFFLWPFFGKRERVYGTERSLHCRAVPFFSYHAEEHNSQPATKRSAWKLWPLARFEQEGTHSTLRMLELWPFAKAEAVERNWAPCWTVFKKVTHADGCEWNLLHGLLGFKKDGGVESFRLMFLTFGGKD